MQAPLPTQPYAVPTGQTTALQPAPMGAPPAGVVPRPVSAIPVGAIPVNMAPQLVVPQPGTARAQPINKWSHLPPNHTLYVNNLNEKLKRDELVKALRHVFGQFGKIVDVVCYTKIVKAKGQAFVVFEDITSATKALREMQNFMFYNKPMRVSYAKRKSDAISKRDGTFVARPKRKKQKVDGKGGKIKMKMKSQFARGQPAQTTAASPHNVLFIENLPQNMQQSAVSMLFQQFSGFQQVRLITNKPGIGFVDFLSIPDAQAAKNALHGFKITPKNNLRISFAKQ